jgi:pSer/pThr/pTyr-binding forkhead associated (FHA) protein
MRTTVVSEPPLDTFLSACGATGPLRLVVEDRSEGGRVEKTFPGPFAVLGSRAAADLVLDHPDVSKRHAYVQVIAGRLFFTDLESRTGIRCEGEARPSGWLGRGERIEIGPYRIGLAGGDRDPHEAGLLPADPLRARPAGDDPLPEVALEFPDRPAGAIPWPVRRVLTLVGRSRRCKVQLADAGVSRCHCSLVRTPGGVWVVDLLGRDGTQLNGTSIRCAQLNDGDRLLVGDFTLRVRVAAPAAAREDSRRALVPAAPAPMLGRVVAERPSESARLAETVLGPMVQQLGLMQQQMFDQFNQTVMTMFQMFASLQRDQMGLVREELDEIRQLTAELQALQAELTNAPPAAEARDLGDRAGASSAAASPPPAAPADRPPPPAIGGEIHALLSRRIADLERERQGHWQRIVHMVLGN